MRLPHNKITTILDFLLVDCETRIVQKKNIKANLVFQDK